MRRIVVPATPLPTQSCDFPPWGAALGQWRLESSHYSWNRNAAVPKARPDGPFDFCMRRHAAAAISHLAKKLDRLASTKCVENLAQGQILAPIVVRVGHVLIKASESAVADIAPENANGSMRQLGESGELLPLLRAK